ncbi:protein involved in gliding motility GldH [Ulvibacter sp. MAR_2010_11]|uniref:gliding motility lipoprotein GldH n=1 Tax=Ulvibacter sp. MAR_2010_11 TaxID=1250229 RepID=UPI000C2C4C11|nr:gliding motility lipoprotein GldH [Ulvibacter sp. MAR_2010_11]PKA82872.1 protein involved in gliding motility GldH [Ulvibacter sp. MAR_2010_11]
MHKIVFLVLIFLVVSCTSDTIVSETQPLPGYWEKDKTVEFSIPQLDSLKKYNVFLHLRNTNEYPYNNLFLIVSMQFPQGKTLVDTLEYRMATPDGTWLGEGIGSVKENKLWYKEKVSFFEEGNYNITITHAVRNNGDVEGVTQLDGITDVGYSIEEALQQ